MQRKASHSTHVVAVACAERVTSRVHVHTRLFAFSTFPLTLKPQCKAATYQQHFPHRSLVMEIRLNLYITKSSGQWRAIFKTPSSQAASASAHASPSFLFRLTSNHMLQYIRVPPLSDRKPSTSKISTVLGLSGCPWVYG